MIIISFWSLQGRLWCYIEEIDGNVYCKDATKSRKWATIVIIIIIIIITIVIIILNLSFPATAALTGLTTLASHQREPISSVSLSSRREGPSATHCLGTERGRWGPFSYFVSIFFCWIPCFFCCSIHYRSTNFKSKCRLLQIKRPFIYIFKAYFTSPYVSLSRSNSVPSQRWPLWKDEWSQRKKIILKCVLWSCEAKPKPVHRDLPRESIAILEVPPSCSPTFQSIPPPLSLSLHTSVATDTYW